MTTAEHSRFAGEHARTEQLLTWLEPRILCGPLAAGIERRGLLRLALPSTTQFGAVDAYRRAASNALYEGRSSAAARYWAWVLRTIAAAHCA
ncbi:hypothetical protein GCM10009836_38430 [Pseudonocardia ailaonensis]|uniref:Uncharacterized protein n=1 Tax=Pseudonocardia ailaonensis TaxID=367279 RepID=A0ABN2N780_9PSEU